MKIERVYNIVEDIKKYGLSMDEIMHLISVLAVEELKTPRVQVTIDARNEKIIDLIKVCLSHYNPDVAIGILTDIATDLVMKCNKPIEFNGDQKYIT